MSGQGRPARTAALPLRSRGQRISYRELSSDTDDDDGISEPDPVDPPRRSSRKRRRGTDDENYPGSADDAGSDGRVGSSLGAGRIDRQPRKSKPASSYANHDTKSHRGAGSKKTMISLGAKRAINTGTKSLMHAQGESREFDISQLGGKIPRWQNLPYEILLNVFQYAWYPLVKDDYCLDTIITSGWLLKTALLCKGFAEPALAALYYAPPLSPPSRARKLLASLGKQNRESYINYRAMIKHLDIEAWELLCRKFQGMDPIQLGELLSSTPQVRSVRLHLVSDHPAWRKGLTFLKPLGNRWASHQVDPFHELSDVSNNDIRLQHWTWNCSLERQARSARLPLLEYHRWKAFQTLKSLEFTNSNDWEHTEKFALSTSVLSRLTSVTFQNVKIDDAKILEALPRNLRVLKFSNCLMLDSWCLGELLATHGSNLRQLVLEHNTSLNLLFLEDLRASCPKLERLKMDLRFFNIHTTYNDSEPRFDLLLPEGCIPSWPESLQCIELFQLRKWDIAAADTFFESLTGSAAALADLRYVDIKASLAESSWRDRISFRNKWISRMDKVFKRISAPPIPWLRSFKTFNMHKRASRNTHGLDESNKTIRVAEYEPRNNPSHVRVNVPSNVGSSGSSDEPLASKRRSTRLKACSDDQPANRPRARKRRRQRRKDDDDSSSEEDSALEDIDTTEVSQLSSVDDEKFLCVQGMCDVVRVVIDNLRPTEEHLDESNFLDDEISGDEDYLD
ncbi:MAG: hypothetical protein LQ346_007434 [Caloplaca aetnensis]|nr:MAG: hypothetical protein LQ346_007434 [Caloplaca aetnensis]